MPDILPNTTTADSYPKEDAIGAAVVGFKSGIFYSGFIVVANAGVFCQIGHGITGQQPRYGQEIYLPPGSYNLSGSPQDPIAGIMFRSAVAGTPAQVFGVLYFPNEARIIASSEFTTQVSSTGSVGGITINPVYVQNWFAWLDGAGAAFAAADAAGRIIGGAISGRIDPLNAFTPAAGPLILVTPMTGWYEMMVRGYNYSIVGNTMVALLLNGVSPIHGQTVTITAGDQPAGQGPSPQIISSNTGDFFQWFGWNTGGGNLTISMGMKLLGVP